MLSLRAARKSQNAVFGITKRFLAFSSVARMKFVQYTETSSDIVKLGVLSDDAQQINELQGIPKNDLKELIKLNLSPADITNKKNVRTTDVTHVKLLAPVLNPEKIICLGLNYSGHCTEQNQPQPKEPIFFSKYNNTLVGPYDAVVAHKISTKIDWEVEMAFVISRKAKHVRRSEAFDYVFGYTVAQDISARDWQRRNGRQFLIGKSMDTFCPLGPAIVHHSLVGDPHNLRIQCSINGTSKQDGNTAELIFKIDDIIECLTKSITLKPGDIVLTGTPAGVGMYRSPREYLKIGDTIESEIEGLGKMINKVVAEK